MRKLNAKHGTLQRPEAAPTELRTRDQLLDAMKVYEFNDNEWLTLPLSPWQHFSIVNYPVMAVHPGEVAVIPLHTTLGVTLVLIDIGLEAVYAAKGADACETAAEALGRALLKDIRVRPTPHQGRALEKREFHRLTAKYPLICDPLASFLPAEQLASVRVGWTDWGAIIGTLNRAADVPDADIMSFTRIARGLVPPLQKAFPWMSVIPKLHALAHDAPGFRYGLAPSALMGNRLSSQGMPTSTTPRRVAQLTPSSWPASAWWSLRLCSGNQVPYMQ